MDPILVVSFPAIGDFIRSHSAVRIIARQFPDRPIDVVTSSIAAPLAEMMPNVRKAWVLDKKPILKSLADRYRLARQLREQKYGTAYLLTSATKASLAPWMAGIPERVGYPREFQFGLVNRFPADWWQQLLSLGKERLRLYDQVCDIATLAKETPPVEGWPAPKLVILPEQMEDWRGRCGLDLTRPSLALYPSAPDDRRAWPIDRFISVAKDYSRRGWSIWIIGAKREREATDQIRAAVPEAINYHSTLTDAMCQIAASTMFVGVDGGPAHAAGALGVPCVLIFRSNCSYEGGPVNHDVRLVEPPISTPGRIGGALGVSVDQVLDTMMRLYVDRYRSQSG
ncbi:lipopolysaccharide heptosyltransferase II [Mesorhizobium shangrilense]|uniref:lipopolysaccharide heptosyltransferase II n=1 Tax=Mesorhizobium shangrilense TaxID=460060 RepID=A0ABV2DA19_9HYPH